MTPDTINQKLNALLPQLTDTTGKLANAEQQVVHLRDQKLRLEGAVLMLQELQQQDAPTQKVPDAVIDKVVDKIIEERPIKLVPPVIFDDEVSEAVN